MKLKTHKGIAKRFKVTKSGKLKYASCGRGHLPTGKKERERGFYAGPGYYKAPEGRNTLSNCCRILND